MTVGADVFSVPMTNRAQAADVKTKATESIAEIRKSLQPILDDLSERIVMPLQLLGLPHVAENIPEADRIWNDSQSLIDHYHQLSKHHQQLLDVFDTRELLRNLLSQLEANPQNQQVISCLLKTMKDGVETLELVRNKVQNFEYPFEHAEQGILLGKFLVAELPQSNNPGAVDGALSHAGSEGLRILIRILGRLCSYVEIIETSLGLPLATAPQTGESGKSES
jgi:hypothetical protein